MTLPVVLEIYDAWTFKPPVHWMMAFQFGIGDETQKTDEEAEQAKLAAEINLFNGT